MSLLDEEIPLQEDTDQSWTFRQENLVELDEFGDDAALVGTSFNQNGLDASTVRRRDDWEEDSGGSLSSSEWGPLVADELTFEPFRKRIKPATRCRLLIIAGLALCVVAFIAIGVVLGMQAAEAAREGGNTDGHNSNNQYQYRNAAVAADAGRCSEIGRDILQKNGSAMDAAIASFFCVGLYNAHSTGIGGGHFMMYYHRDTKSMDMIDARESAPMAAYRDMYTGTNLSSTVGGSAIGVPGEVDGLWKAHQRHGKLPWKTLLEPTIKMARKGYKATAAMARAAAAKIDVIRADPGLRQLFSRADGSPIEAGDVLYQHTLADTLDKIANGGADAFYRGELTNDIVQDINDRGGNITADDLDRYQAKIRTPLVVELDDGLRVYSPPPPSSGAVLSLILNILDGFHIDSSSFSNTNTKILTFHKMVEAFKFAYAKRAYLGDEDFVDVQKLVANMTSREIADILRSKINDNSTHKPQFYGMLHSVTDDQGTSHLCILDQYGNAVSATGTVNLYFGSKVVGNRTGIVFNNEMDDFSKPNTANYFGFPPSETNYIVPGKRPMSSMTPTIVVDNEGDVRLVIGASGGSRIPTATVEVMIRNIWGGVPVSDAIRQRRLHHQWIPDLIVHEKGYDQDILAGLQAKGHNITETLYLAVVQAISRTKEGVIQAFCDERKGGYPAGF